MEIEELSTDLIAVFEGCRLRAYQDSGGVWTIGFGETGPQVVEGATCTYEQARAWLRAQIQWLLPLVGNLPVLQAAALVSFGYNSGRSHLLNVLAGRDTILNPVHSTDRKGNVVPGLVARRKLEADLYLLALEATGAPGPATAAPDAAPAPTQIS